MNLKAIVAKGPQPGADGDNVPFRVEDGSAALFGGLHGKYFTHGLHGLVFSCATVTQGIQFPDATNAAPASPLALYNPPTSKKYVSVIRWEFVITTAPVTPVIGAYILLTATNWPLQIAGANVLINSIISRTRNNSAIPTSSNYLNTGPAGNTTFYRLFTNHLTGAVTTTPNGPPMAMEFDGTCILAPNTGLFIAQLNQDATNAIPESKCIWEEFPFP